MYSPSSKSPDGKMCKINCANTEGIFRIIQSILSSKADPFKCWLAKIVGDAREKLEIETGDKVVSSEKYLTEPESRKRLKEIK